MQTNCNYKYNIYRIIILTFIITALWDVVLRTLSLYNPIPSVKAFFPFIQYLEPYFMKHTLLAAGINCWVCWRHYSSNYIVFYGPSYS